MYPRKQIDLTLLDLVAPLLPGPRRPLDVSDYWPQPDQVLVTFSVRSGLDLLFQALALPAGSEVIVSEVTIPHVADLIREHGLTVVPAPVCADTLSPSPREVERLLSPRTKILIVTQLFGSHISLEPFAQLARRHGLLLVEDAAQSFRGPQSTFDEWADVSMTSFGLIKTCTSLYGAVLNVKDPNLRRRMLSIEEGYPPLPSARLVRRLSIAVVFLCASKPRILKLIAGVCALFNINLGELLSTLARSFPSGRIIPHIRFRLPFYCRRLLARRLRKFRHSSIAERTCHGEMLISLLPFLARPGASAENHSHWIFPVFVRDAASVARALYAAGFDAAPTTSNLVSLSGTPHWMDSILYLPFSPALMKKNGARRLAAELARPMSEVSPKKEAA